ncbi:MAG TPA: hypothetical protein VFL83_09010 [Anaeromyxobacter sp.]|nr:hypothetical protein [Anaeromyxobacter sp.]
MQPARDYSYRVIVERIRDEIDYRQLQDSAVYKALRISKDQWSRKMRVNDKATGGRGASFTLAEIARLADLFHSPPGWPFIDKAALEQYVRNLDPLMLRWIRNG